jgi:hypothetical protein
LADLAFDRHLVGSRINSDCCDSKGNLERQVTRRQIAAEVAQIARDWMLKPCDPKDFNLVEVEKEPDAVEMADLIVTVREYLEKVRACLKT